MNSQMKVLLKLYFVKPSQWSVSFPSTMMEEHITNVLIGMVSNDMVNSNNFWSHVFQAKFHQKI